MPDRLPLRVCRAIGRSRVLSPAMLLATISLVCNIYAASAQTTIHVPADVGTIQAGIDAAKNGDTVFVSPGTYNENLDFKGKAITVTTGAKSFADAATVIVNGTTDGPVVNFATNEPAGAVLNGFTLQGGHSNVQTIAGGIFISNASPTVTNNIIQNNLGCGIFVVNQGSPLVQGNDIRGTSYSNDNGHQCGSGNGAGTEGTGIALSNAGTVQLIGNTIEENTQILNDGAAVTYGAGVYINGGLEVQLQNNIIRNNVGDESQGMATFNPPAKLILIQNLFYGNNNGGVASPIQVELLGPSLAPYPSITEVNNTIAGIGGGEGIGYQWVSSTIANNLFIDTFSIVNPSTQADSAGLSCGNTVFTNSNNDSFNEGLPVPSSCPSGAGLLAVDPQFINPSAFDFHTQRNSPVVAAGDINAPMIPPTDLAGKNRTVCGTIDIGVYQVHPEPPIALTVSPNPAPGQSNVTLTATLTGNCNIPTGLITFMDGATVLGTAMLNGGAVASFSTSFLFVGTHFLTASYPGDFNFHGSTSDAVTEVITGPPTKTVLSVSPNPALPLQLITMSATVSSAYTVPAGTITFMAEGKALAPPLTASANGSASATISTLGAGTYSITAVYSGSTEYASSTSNAVLEVVNGAPTTTTLTSSLDPSSYGQSVTFTAAVAAPQSATTPTGTVTFMDGATALGSAPLSASQVAQFSTAGLAVGNHSITAVYNGSTNDAKSTSNVLTQVVGLDATHVLVTATPQQAYAGQTVTLTVVAVSAYGMVPSPVVLTEGGSTLGTLLPDASGGATLALNSLTAGLHTIVATYAGDVHHAGSSASTTVTILASGFGVTLSPPVLTLREGTVGRVNVVVSSIGVFAGDLTLSADGLPASVQSGFTPGTVMLQEGGSGAAVLQLGVGRPLTAKLRGGGYGGLVAAAVLLLVPVGLRRRWRMRHLLVLALAVTMAVGASGCTERYVAIQQVVPGTYTVRVTATDAQGHAKSATTTLVVPR